MITLHEISDNKRVRINQGISKRTAEYQENENGKWITLCSRPYNIDIRVNAVTDILRVANQRGFKTV